MFWLALAGLAVSGASAYQQNQAAKKAQQFRELQAAEERKRANIMAVRNSREQIRQQRMEAARVANAAALSGTSNSSGAVGAVAGSASDLSSNLAFSNKMSAIDSAVGAAGLGAARASTQGQIWGSYGQFGSTIFSGAGGFGAIDKGGVERGWWQ